MATSDPVLHPVHHLSGHLSPLTNFADFLAFRAFLRLYFVGHHCFGSYWSRPGGLGARVFCTLALQFKGGSKQDAWIGIWIVIRAECGHCGHILVPAVVN